MTKRNKAIIFKVIFILSVFLFFFIKYNSPAFVELVYKNSSLLERSHSLDYYLGKAEDLVFGPVCSVISGALFLVCGFIYLRKSTARQFGIAVFLYLLITRFEVLLYPPFGDSLVAVFSDAIWLVRNSFDYAGYIKLGNFSTSGPQAYLTSIYPSFLALWLYILPSANIFLVLIHVFVFGMAAFIAATFRELLKESFDGDTALMGSIFLVSLPLFQSMAELINMEMPCLLFAVVSMCYLSKRNIVMASIMGIMSSFIKDPGSIVSMAVFAVSILLYVFEANDKNRLRNLVWGTVGILAVILRYMVRKFTVVHQPEYNNVSLLVGWSNIKGMFTFWLFIAVCLLLAVHALIWWYQQDEKMRTPALLFGKYYCVIVMVVMTACWFVLYANFSVMAPRYQLLLAPFYVFCVIYAVSLLIHHKQVYKTVFFLSVLVSFVCSHGLLYGSSYPFPHEFNVFERSLEYRNSIKLHMDIAKEFEGNYSDYTIGAPLFIARALNFRELGCVNKKLDVMVYGYNASHEGVRQFQGLDKLDVAKTVWIAFPDEGLKLRGFSGIEYPISSDDKIIKVIRRGDKNAVIFAGGFGIHRMREFLNMLMEPG